MATAKTATTRKTAAKKAPAKKAAARKAAPKKAQEFSVRDSAEKMVNIYLGVIGKSIDTIQDSMDTARKDNEKRLKEWEERGAKLRKELGKRLERFESSDVVEDAKEQLNKVQDQIEDAVDSVKDKLKAA